MRSNRPAVADEPLAGDEMAALLRTIRDRAATDEQLDSATISRRLGWTAAATAAAIDVAKGRLLVWGIRVGGTPGPCFEEVELTVQGRRFLTAFDA